MTKRDPPPESEPRAKLAAGLLDEARSRIQAKIQEGLDALERGGAIDGDAFFDRMKARIHAPCDTTE